PPRDDPDHARPPDPTPAALASPGRFADTLGMLAAAVQLLAARAGDAASEPRRVELAAPHRTGKAA
ncbi:MAG: hypothetical protein ACKOES_10585, partial [Planctomycetaceae bacterium]